MKNEPRDAGLFFLYYKSSTFVIMAELIKFDPRSKEVVLHPEALKLSPVFKKVKPKDLRYIHLAYDYNSIFHQFTEKDRKNKAKFATYGNIDYDPEDNQHMKDAIEEYKSLQYDHRKEMLRVYQEKIMQLTFKLMDENSESKMLSIQKTISALDKELVDLDKAIQEGERKLILKGGGGLTLVEDWQKNKAKRLRDEQIKKQSTGQMLI